MKRKTIRAWCIKNRVNLLPSNIEGHSRLQVPYILGDRSTTLELLFKEETPEAEVIKQATAWLADITKEALDFYSL